MEKIPGGELSECRVLTGVMFSKCDARQMTLQAQPTYSLLHDCLSSTKGESNANLEIMKDSDWDEILRLEEEYIQKISSCIIKMKPDVITEKGLSDLCQHYLVKAGISAIRRIRKTDNNRIARFGCRYRQPSEDYRADIGTDAGLFEVRKIGDEYFTFIEECKSPRPTPSYFVVPPRTCSTKLSVTCKMPCRLPATSCVSPCCFPVAVRSRCALRWLSRNTLTRLKVVPSGHSLWEMTRSK